MRVSRSPLRKRRYRLLDLVPLAQESDLTRARNPPRQGSDTHGTSWYFPSPRTPRPLPLAPGLAPRWKDAPGSRARWARGSPTGRSVKTQRNPQKQRAAPGGLGGPYAVPAAQLLSGGEGEAHLHRARGSGTPIGDAHRSQDGEWVPTQNVHPDPVGPPRPCRTSPVASEGAWGVPRGTTSGGMDPLFSSHWKVTVSE